MKHYYSDDGIMQYQTPPKEMLKELEKALSFARKDNVYQVGLVINESCVIVLDYDAHVTMEGLGGCTSVKEWERESEKNDLLQALKRIFFNYLEQGFLPHEFPLAAWNVICVIHIDQFMRRGNSTRDV